MDTQKITSNEAAKFLLDTGLLFEINWKILHPFGLSLVVSEDTASGKIDLVGISKTNDPIGWTFSDSDFLTGLHKLKRFVLKRDNIERLSARKISLGSTIQNESDKDTHTAPIQEGLV